MKQQVLTKKHRKVGGISASGIPMTGPCPEGPERCLFCGQPLKPGECWHRHTSPLIRTMGRTVWESMTGAPPDPG